MAYIYRTKQKQQEVFSNLPCLYSIIFCSLPHDVSAIVVVPGLEKVLAGVDENGQGLDVAPIQQRSNRSNRRPARNIVVSYHGMEEGDVEEEASIGILPDEDDDPLFHYFGPAIDPDPSSRRRSRSCRRRQHDHDQ